MAARRASIKFSNILKLKSATPLALRQEMMYPSCRSEREDMSANHRIELPQGTLDLLILQTLVLEPQHGWAISERVQQISSDVLCIQQGSLYPALHRLERRGWIKAHWGVSENNRRAKYYELTKSGRQQLEAEKDAWVKLTAAMAQVLGTA
jgi:transcriptional regulator